MKTNTLLASICTAAAMLFAGVASAQVAQAASANPESSVPVKLWSLDDCMNYAIENNITVQQYSLDVESNEVQLLTSKLSRLPNLNAGIDGRYSNYRADYIVNSGSAGELSSVYGRRNTTEGSFSISTSVPVFQGMKINKQIKGGKLDLAAAIQDLERAREDLSINIMTLYVQVLYNKELLRVAENQLELSTQQAVRSREQVSAGKQPESARYESEALQAKDQLAVTEADNNLRIALLDLSQALNRESAAGFDIVEPVFDSLALATLHMHGSVGSVYAYAAENRPYIKAERLRLESAENSVAIAKSALYPTISLSAGYSTGVRDANDESFWTQIRRSRTPYVGATMNIPIFNRRATRNDINLAKIATRNQQLNVTKAEQNVRKDIEQAWYNAEAAYSKYRSAEVAFESAKIAFAYEEQKSEAGRSTIFDFNDAKTRMEKAESDLVQAKYQFVFSSKILDYYWGRPLRL